MCVYIYIKTIVEKGKNCSWRAISPLIHNIFYLLNFYVRTGTRISLRDKRLFEITKVEIARVDCIYFSSSTLYPLSPPIERHPFLKGKKYVSLPIWGLLYIKRKFLLLDTQLFFLCRYSHHEKGRKMHVCTIWKLHIVVMFTMEVCPSTLTVHSFAITN